MFRWKMSRRCTSGMPITSSSLRTKLKKSHHGLLRRPSLANSTKQQAVSKCWCHQMVKGLPENIWKRQALPIKLGHPAPTTWNENVLWLVLACSPNKHRPRTSMLPHRYIWKLSQENYLWLQWHTDMLSPWSNGNESNSHVVPISPCPPNMI